MNNIEKMDCFASYILYVIIPVENRNKQFSNEELRSYFNRDGPLQSPSIAKKSKTSFQMKIEGASETRATAVTESAVAVDQHNNLFDSAVEQSTGEKYIGGNLPISNFKAESNGAGRLSSQSRTTAMRKANSPAKRKADQQAWSSAENASTTDSSDDEDYSVEKFTGTRKMHACKLCDKQTTWISRHYRRSHDMSESVIHRFCRPFRYKGKILRILLIYFRSTVQ
jgi:hypothetical protein